MGFYASIDGEIAPAERSRVSVLDNGFTFGDAVYETLRTYGGRPFHLDRHLRRLRASAARIGIDPGDGAVLAQRLDAVLARAANPESYIRIQVSRGVGDVSYRFERIKGPTHVLLVKPYEPPPPRVYEEGVAVIVSAIRRNHPLALDPAIKSCNLLNNLQAVREAQARGAFEPILLNQDAEVAEGASSNLFLVRGGVVLTPPQGAGILPGITRELVLELGRGAGVTVREESLRAPDLFAAQEAFITSTLKELVPIATIDGTPVGSGRPGPVTLKLLATFRAYAHRRA